MKIVVIGAGYVGLVTAALLAELGHHVTCIEHDARRLAALRIGRIHFHEPGLDAMVRECRLAGRLHFTDQPDAITRAQAVYLAVGTPPGPEGQTDLSQIDQAVVGMAHYLRENAVVVVKSTVPVGTGDRIEALLRVHCAPGRTVSVVSNPEFLREGAAVEDARNPDRIVIGANEPSAGDIVEQLYANIDGLVVRTDRRSSELIKYTANAFLATRISFANTMARLCDAMGATVDDVMRGAGLDRRVGTAFFKPGLGFGGSCFPKDVSSLVFEGVRANVRMDLLESVLDVNDGLPTAFVEKMKEKLGSLRGRTVAVLGLAFKGDTDDVRESRSLVLVRQLVARGARVRAYDPQARQTAAEALTGTPVTFTDSALEAATGADVLVVATDWKEFSSLDFEVVAKRMRGVHVFDGRNHLDPDRVASAGLAYQGVGRPLAATDAPALEAA